MVLAQDTEAELRSGTPLGRVGCTGVHVEPDNVSAMPDSEPFVSISLFPTATHWSGRGHETALSSATAGPRGP